MAEELTIRIDLENCYIDDLETIVAMAGSGKMPEPGTMKAFMDLLDRVVVGGVRGKGIPMTALGQIGQQLMQAINEGMNPGGN